MPAALGAVITVVNMRVHLRICICSESRTATALTAFKDNRGPQKDTKNFKRKNSKTISRFSLSTQQQQNLPPLGKDKGEGKETQALPGLGDETALSRTVSRSLSLMTGVCEFALLSLPLTSLAYKHFAQHNDWPAKGLQCRVIEFLAIEYSI